MLIVAYNVSCCMQTLHFGQSAGAHVPWTAFHMRTLQAALANWISFTRIRINVACPGNEDGLPAPGAEVHKQGG